MAGQFSLGDYLNDIEDIDRRHCKGEAKSGCGAYILGKGVSGADGDFVKDVVSRIDESMASPENVKKNHGRGFDNKEYSLALYLAMRGKEVMSRDDSDGAGDAWVNGVRSEFKAPTSRSAVQGRLKKAHGQGVDHVYLDVRDTGLSDGDVERAVNGQVKSFGGGPTFREVWVVSDSGFRRFYGDG
ncbi:hypothetical protein [Streptomyces arboris]|uniref:Uncharacterized protein n=1 Tax=Streptomyces arboris TaxID=2600619 RepID=A0A5N5ECK9_9ACTN|nr:hypothetical protein [Streptomyces arboris]KAB2587633.1 hypothetical protein F5983_36945 [Streptomyces arboris]